MKKLTVAAISVCLGWGLFAAEGFTAKSPKKSRSRYICQDNPADASGWERHRAPYLVPYKYAPSGLTYQTSCADINPEAGSIVEHDQIGTTWYEYQHNDNMGRMISVTSDGYRHFSWTYAEGPYPGVPRYVYANCKDPAGSFLGDVPADGGEVNAGYSNQTHLHDGTSVIVNHRNSGTPKWLNVLTIANGVCTDTFSRHWDIPDYIMEATMDEPGMWPRVAATYDSTDGRDYVHILHREAAAVG
jgi:hypothetical protein